MLQTTHSKFIFVCTSISLTLTLAGPTQAASPQQGAANNAIYLAMLAQNAATAGEIESPTDSAPSVAGGKYYYVSTTGNDSNAGTLTQPFKTVQKCASVAQAGETCLIRGGTYRETVTPANNGSATKGPITFANYKDEKVIISGADVIEGAWTLHKPNIYKTSLSKSIKNLEGDPNTTGAMAVDDQLWVDGQMMITARWPNLPISKATYFTRTDLAITTGGASNGFHGGVYTDTALSSFSAGFWNGAKMNVAPGQMWINVTCDVTNSTAQSLSVDCGELNTGLGEYQMRADNHYFLWGKLDALDAPGEWWQEKGSVYVWLPDSGSPIGHTIEAKRRLWAFDLSGRAHIEVKGLSIFAASIKTGSPTGGTGSNITLNELDIQYPWYFVEYPRNSRKMSFNGAIRLYGSNNTLKNSLIRYTASDVLRIEGSNNRVENNVFYDIAFMGASHPINGQLSDATAAQYFEQNTIFNSGTQAVNMAPMWKIRYNDAYKSHGLVTDTGTFYSWGTNGKGAEIAYNYVHDNWAIRGGRNFPQFFGGSNIYFDFATSNYVAHHNVTWGATKAGILVFGYDHNAIATLANPDPNAQAISIINNTVDADLFIDTKTGVHMTNTKVINNLVAKYANAVTAANGVSYLSNATIANSSIFVDRVNRDYRLNGTVSGVANAGTAIAPYTDGYAGSAPDIGAFEGNSQPWVAGALLRQSDLAQLSATCTGSVSLQCSIGNLPTGRKAPTNFKVLVGLSDVKTLSNCRNVTDYSRHSTSVTCTYTTINAPASPSGSPIRVQIGDGEAVQIGKL